MNKNTRLLPQLNICFLQKKAFQVHRKKIDYIKQSLRSSLIKKQDKDKSHDHSQYKLSSSKTHHDMSTIKQQPTNRFQKLNPLLRRKIIENQKENHRLIKRIQTCSSTINRRDIERHMVRSKQIKNRLCKFKYDPESKKTELKSIHSLQILQKFKQRDYDAPISVSRSLRKEKSVSRFSKSLITKISKEDSEKTSQIGALTKKSSFDKLMSRRNVQKISVHFGKDDFVSRAKARLQDMRKGNSTEMKSKRRSEVEGSYWKSRCFTTQVENYH